MMIDNENLPVYWILAGADEETAVPTITITPESVAIVSLVDCAGQLEAMGTQPLRLALAAKSAHLALQAALTAALAGTANIGAHDDKLAEKHLAYLEDRGAGNIPWPNNDRVMSFGALLAKAQRDRLPWGEAIQLSDKENQLLDRLSGVRHAFEHPKQHSNAIYQDYILETLPITAQLVVTLIETVSHHISADDFNALKNARDRILFCSERLAG